MRCCTSFVARQVNPFAARHVAVHQRPFHLSALQAVKALPARRAIDESEITESFLKGTGPGGQAINKTNSAVQITHLPTGIVVKSQETRSRSQNRKLARGILAEKLDVLRNGDQSRLALKTALKSKRKASKDKKARRKYRKLAEGESVADPSLDPRDSSEKPESDHAAVDKPGKSPGNTPLGHAPP